MFSKPNCGRSTVSIKDTVIGYISHIEDIPVDTLETLISYLKGETNHFEIVYAGEEYDFGICQINGELYTFNNHCDKIDIIGRLDLDYKDSSILEIVRKLAKEIYYDFTNDFDAWIMFYLYYDSEDNIDKHKIKFKALLNELKNLLDKSYHEIEIGNFLFGNSHGKYCVERGEFEEAFLKFLTQCGFDSYGNINDEKLERLCITDSADKSNSDYVYVFNNGTFEIRPYYWGNDEKLTNKANFVYMPDNIEISWYKYALRDAYSNKQLTFEYFCRMLKTCAKSLNIDLEVNF